MLAAARIKQLKNKKQENARRAPPRGRTPPSFLPATTVHQKLSTSGNSHTEKQQQRPSLSSFRPATRTKCSTTAYTSSSNHIAAAAAASAAPAPRSPNKVISSGPTTPSSHSTPPPLSPLPAAPEPHRGHSTGLHRGRLHRAVGSRSNIDAACSSIGRRSIGPSVGLSVRRSVIRSHGRSFRRSVDRSPSYQRRGERKKNTCKGGPSRHEYRGGSRPDQKRLHNPVQGLSIADAAEGHPLPLQDGDGVWSEDARSRAVTDGVEDERQDEAKEATDAGAVEAPGELDEVFCLRGAAPRE